MTRGSAASEHTRAAHTRTALKIHAIDRPLERMFECYTVSSCCQGRAVPNAIFPRAVAALFDAMSAVAPELPAPSLPLPLSF